MCSCFLIPDNQIHLNKNLTVQINKKKSVLVSKLIQDTRTGFTKRYFNAYFNFL